MITLTRDAASAPITRHTGAGVVAEQYYSLAHLLQPAGDQSSAVGKLVGITSCAPGAGVSTVAANLAIAAAESGDRPVLLLDLSSTRPSLADRFAMFDDLGLRDALAPGAHPSQCVKPSPIDNLSLLAVNDPGDARELSIDGSRVNALLRSLEHDFGFIVVDLPTTNSGLCVATAGMFDGILLVMEAERTNSEAALRAKQRLIHANARFLGIILNKHRRHIPAWLDTRL